MIDAIEILSAKEIRRQTLGEKPQGERVFELETLIFFSKRYEVRLDLIEALFQAQSFPFGSITPLADGRGKLVVKFTLDQLYSLIRGCYNLQGVVRLPLSVGYYPRSDRRSMKEAFFLNTPQPFTEVQLIRFQTQIFDLAHVGLLAFQPKEG